ncbi:DNA-directed RNA polymerase, subunit E'' [Candidatus Bathyarchaeota archaeon]|nr:DNA-directed RNA polymerase, subunit E'' [Candidatus Bathyarchaeota archaeon]RLG93427.1 MAG: DNA-directed RNA polymerase subunit E'' [Candidatus Bathyarchaeota archaeon]
MVDKACRRCHLITDKSVCPQCKSTDLSDDFSGIVIILDPENSEIAKLMNISRKGRYAVRIR